MYISAPPYPSLASLPFPPPTETHKNRYITRMCANVAKLSKRFIRAKCAKKENTWEDNFFCLQIFYTKENILANFDPSTVLFVLRIDMYFNRDLGSQSSSNAAGVAVGKYMDNYITLEGSLISCIYIIKYIHVCYCLLWWSTRDQNRDKNRFKWNKEKDRSSNRIPPDSNHSQVGIETILYSIESQVPMVDLLSTQKQRRSQVPQSKCCTRRIGPKPTIIIIMIIIIAG